MIPLGLLLVLLLVLVPLVNLVVLVELIRLIDERRLPHLLGSLLLVHGRASLVLFFLRAQVRHVVLPRDLHPHILLHALLA